MDRIETGSEVHSISTHKDLKTRTLYEMVTAWAEQPWNGNQYKRISEELWDSIDASDLMDGPYGVSVTLLESYVVDSVEKLNAGLFDMNQAVAGLTTLLENDDFTEGAKIIEVSVETNPVCRISNMDDLLQEKCPRGSQKPQWWKRSVRSFWISMGVVSFVAMFSIYVIVIGLEILQPIQLVLAMAVGIPMYAMSYLFRKLATKRFWRAVFIMLGAGGIGFWCLIIPLSFFFAPVIQLIPWMIGMPLLTIPSVGIGAFIGDWIGKRRDYRPYM